MEDDGQQSPPGGQVQTWLADDAGVAWQRGAELRGDAMLQATALMFELAGLASGMKVLDVAAGTGDQTLLVAELVGAAGEVIATDLSPSMLEVAARRAAEAGLSNISTQVADAQDLEFPEGTFDAAICRNGLMFVPDLAKALGKVYRALKPGARFAATVWSTPERNAFMAVPAPVVARVAGFPTPPALAATFKLGQPRVLAEFLTGARFGDVQVRPAAVVRRFPSAAAAAAHIREGAGPARSLVSKLTEEQWRHAHAELEQAFSRYEGPEGCVLRGEVLVGAGTR